MNIGVLTHESEWGEWLEPDLSKKGLKVTLYNENREAIESVREHRIAGLLVLWNVEDIPTIVRFCRHHGVGVVIYAPRSFSLPVEASIVVASGDIIHDVHNIFLALKFA